MPLSPISKTHPLSFIFNLSLTIFSLALILFAAEFFLRITHYGIKNFCPVRTDLNIGWRYAPNARYWFFRENDHAIRGRMNRFGWRGNDWAIEKSPGTFRVAVLGDSMVEGMQVEFESLFTSIAETSLRQSNKQPVEILNFGRSGTTQSEQLLILQSDASRFDPDLVVLFFNPANDIDDISPETDVYKIRPYFWLSRRSELRLDTSFADSREFRIRSMLIPFRENSALISLIVERISSWRKSKKHSEKEAMQLRSDPGDSRLMGSSTLATAHPNSIYTSNYILNKRLIREMAEICRAQRRRFMVAVLSGPDYKPDVEMERKALDSSYNAYFFEDDLGHLAEETGSEFLGLQRIFSEAYRQTGKPLHWDHLNYAGHQLIAQKLAEKISPMLKGSRT